MLCTTPPSASGRQLLRNPHATSDGRPLEPNLLTRRAIHIVSRIGPGKSRSRNRGARLKDPLPKAFRELIRARLEQRRVIDDETLFRAFRIRQSAARFSKHQIVHVNPR
jgi:hypothetical protein